MYLHNKLYVNVFRTYITCSASYLVHNSKVLLVLLAVSHDDSDSVPLVYTLPPESHQIKLKKTFIILFVIFVHMVLVWKHLTSHHLDSFPITSHPLRTQRLMGVAYAKAVGRLNVN